MNLQNLGILYQAMFLIFTASSAAAVALSIHKGKVIAILKDSRDAWKDRSDYEASEHKLSDQRHEAVLAEYREKITGYTAELQNYIVALGDAKAQVANLEARTDFKPVWDFQQQAFSAQQKWFEECSVLHERNVDLLAAVAPIMERVVVALENIHCKPLSGHST